jgi:hypothetical protein
MAGMAKASGGKTAGPGCFCLPYYCFVCFPMAGTAFRYEIRKQTHLFYKKIEKKSRIFCGSRGKNYSNLTAPQLFS